MNYLLARLKEPSTYRGIALVLAGIGVHTNPELIPTIGTAVAGVIGLIEVIRKEP